MTNEVRIETSTLCNFSCKFCPHNTELKRKKEIMSLEGFKFILNKIKKEAPYIDTCTLSGLGEPLLDPTIEEKIEYAKKLGYKVILLTNASLLDKKNIEVDLLKVSFHTPNKDKFKEITGTNNFDLVLNNIYNTKNKVAITSDLTENFKEEIEGLKRIFEDKVYLLEIWKPHNWVNWGNYRSGEATKKTCGRPEKGPIQIQVNGTINMCCFDFNGELLLGDFYTQTLEEIFSSKSFKEIEEKHKTYNKEGLICKNCDQLIDLENTLLYSSKFFIKDRVHSLSTTFKKVN
ncbi:MAG: radical SAM protein [Candidatus Omnitrophica bacterium]|nr:radical SAM protein [Candidatus Omnitrophota bacterium]